jgi:hypothetical protein
MHEAAALIQREGRERRKKNKQKGVRKRKKVGKKGRTERRTASLQSTYKSA